MAKNLQILDFKFPGGKVPEWYVGPEKILAVIPGISERFDAVKDCLKKPGFVDTGKALDLLPFCRDFFGTWATSSPVVLHILGQEKVLAILEFLSTRRQITWESYDYEYFVQLPDRIQIFRGGSGAMEEVLQGFSWSMDREIATYYANQSQEGGILLQAEINKEDILLVYPGENELVPRRDALIDPKVIT